MKIRISLCVCMNGKERERKRERERDWTLLHKDRGLGTNACRSTCPWNSYKHLYIYKFIPFPEQPQKKP